MDGHIRKSMSHWLRQLREKHDGAAAGKLPLGDRWTRTDKCFKDIVCNPLSALPAHGLECATYGKAHFSCRPWNSNVIATPNRLH